MTCQARRPCTPTSLDEGALVIAHLGPRAAKQQSWITALRFLGVNGIPIQAARTTTPRAAETRASYSTTFQSKPKAASCALRSGETMLDLWRRLLTHCPRL